MKLLHLSIDSSTVAMVICAIVVGFVTAVAGWSVDEISVSCCCCVYVFGVDPIVIIWSL